MQTHPDGGGAEVLQPGQITFAVMARNATNEPNRLVAASIGVASPPTPHSTATSPNIIRSAKPTRRPENTPKISPPRCSRPRSAWSSIPNLAWDEREKIYKMTGKIVKTYNVTQSAEGHKDGIWTTVVACAILLP